MPGEKSRYSVLSRRGLAAGCLLILALLMPFAFQSLIGLNKTIYGEYFLDQGISASMGERFFLNLGYFFRNTSHPLFLTLLVCLGAWGLLGGKGKRYPAVVSAAWLIGYFTVYLFIEGHFK